MTGPQGGRVPSRGRCRAGLFSCVPCLTSDGSRPCLSSLYWQRWGLPEAASFARAHDLLELEHAPGQRRLLGMVRVGMARIKRPAVARTLQGTSNGNRRRRRNLRVRISAKNGPIKEGKFAGALARRRG
ncbi:hypothetical protein CHELA40_11942 [Chelatococcus asaccharovorans]|nr:hypothetical protein CHELA40_11942 [Chelatococcus asaccharovorans]